MKTYTIIAVIALGFLLTACTADSEETHYAKPEQVQKFDSFDNYAREGDSIIESDPLKPKGKD